jgi:hypothetical protein
MLPENVKVGDGPSTMMGHYLIYTHTHICTYYHCYITIKVSYDHYNSCINTLIISKGVYLSAHYKYISANICNTASLQYDFLLSHFV